MRRTILIITVLLVAAGASGAPAPLDNGVIRLRSSATGGGDEAPAAAGTEQVHVGAARRGFDYASFLARLESVWFQRKTLLARGRDEDARELLERIRASCAEEGVKRLDHVAGALAAEARRDLREGSYERALSSLRVAAELDPNRPQLHMMQAAVHWKADHALVAAAGQIVAALRATLLRSIQDLSLFHQLLFLLVLAIAGGGLVFALMMALRHHVAFRHEIEEWCRPAVGVPLAAAAGWAALVLPLLTWIAAGWLALYWIAVMFRYMARRERWVAVWLLAAGAATLPVYRVGVALFGAAADPAVRTTLLSVGGEYDPDRVVRLRELVDTHPEDPVYHFLLAGLYKNGRYFEEAFAEYRQALDLDPALYPAYINIGNVFYATGQYGEAIVNYGKASALEPQSLLAYFNRHLAQSEDFRFADAEESLRAARAIDADRVATLLSAGRERPTAQDAALELVSIWESALGGRSPLPGRPAADGAARAEALPLFDPIGIACLATFVICAGVAIRSRGSETARRCIRCGEPFCGRCKRERNEGHEYCTACLHLFIRGDGLAPAAKTRKLEEVRIHGRRSARLRRAVSVLVPGAGHLLRGRPAWGTLLAVAWIASIVALRPLLAWTVGRLVGFELQPELLIGTRSVPVSTDVTPLALLAVPCLPLLWVAGNLRRPRRREA